jgi:phenylpropionate dioxygenase-like ring-hydroxylating dioxygenase large terminal subunit
MATTDAYAHSFSATFTREDNDLLTRVGPGTLMGSLFRQYWIPVVPSSHLEQPGGKPLRVKLLGEDLVAFRTKEGTVGVLGAYCSHRLAPLFFGRVEGDGIRCPYHGWKFAPGGACIEMPNVPPEHQFKERIRHLGYPAVEHGGVIWTYMGASETLPALPEFEFTMIPADQTQFRLFHHECNYLQAMEGGIDPTHVMWLHSPYDLGDDRIAQAHQPPQQRIANTSGKRTPEGIEIVDTAGGFMYGARRPIGNGRSLWRINQFIFPFYTMPPGGDQRGGRMWVPIDDEHCVKWMFTWYPTRQIMESTKEKPRPWLPEEDYIEPTNDPYGHVIPKAHKANDYLINWETHTTRRMGIAGVNLQDKCVQENEGPTPILDRTKENLCVGDLTVVKVRRLLRQAALALHEKGTIPPGVRDPGIYRVRAASTEVPDDRNWVESVKDAVTVPPRAA